MRIGIIVVYSNNIINDVNIYKSTSSKLSFSLFQVTQGRRLSTAIIYTHGKDGKEKGGKK